MNGKHKRWWQAGSEFDVLCDIVGGFLIEVVVLSVSFYVLIRIFAPWVE